MKLFCPFLVICLLSTANIKGAPTLPDGETIVKLVSAIADDVSSIAIAKAATTGFVGGGALKSVSDNVPSADDVYLAVVNTGNSAARVVVQTGNSAARVGEDTWNYVRRKLVIIQCS